MHERGGKGGRSLVTSEGSHKKTPLQFQSLGVLGREAQTFIKAVPFGCAAKALLMEKELGIFQTFQLIQLNVVEEVKHYPTLKASACPV